TPAGRSRYPGKRLPARCHVEELVARTLHGERELVGFNRTVAAKCRHPCPPETRLVRRHGTGIATIARQGQEHLRDLTGRRPERGGHHRVRYWSKACIMRRGSKLHRLARLAHQTRGSRRQAT